jgi:histidine triad (HIT) family protein
VHDELSVAFLDIAPIRPGHALMIPRRHEPDFLSLTPNEHASALELAAASPKPRAPFSDLGRWA